MEDSSLCTVTGWGYPKANGESEPPPPIPKGEWRGERTWVWLGCPMDEHFWNAFLKELTAPGTFFFASHLSSLLPLGGLVSEHTMVR